MRKSLKNFTNNRNIWAQIDVVVVIRSNRKIVYDKTFIDNIGEWLFFVVIRIEIMLTLYNKKLQNNVKYYA